MSLFQVEYFVPDEWEHGLELNAMDKALVKVSPMADRPDDIRSPTAGQDFAAYLTEFHRQEPLRPGAYQVFALPQSLFNWTGFKGVLNDVNLCSRRQLVILKDLKDVETLRAFHAKLAALLERETPVIDEPTFAQDLEINVKFTLVGIGPAAVDKQAFIADYTASLAPFIASLNSVIPTQVTVQV